MIEQGRAAFAFKKAQEGMNNLNREIYPSYTKKVPMLIKTNGLAQTLAFMKAKKHEYMTIYNQIEEWLNLEQNDYLLKAQGKELLDKVISSNSSTYRQITIEVLAFLSWLSRFAEGMKKDE